MLEGRGRDEEGKGETGLRRTSLKKITADLERYLVVLKVIVSAVGTGLAGIDKAKTNV